MYTPPVRPDEIYHYGVKGMHWGVRRYQNYDGTLIHPKGDKNGRAQKEYHINDPKGNKSVRVTELVKSSLDDPAAGIGTIRKEVASSILVSAASVPVSVAIGMAGMPVTGAYTAATGLAVGAAGVSSMHDLAVGKKAIKDLKKENERIAAIKEVDKATGFHKKQEEMTPEEDMKHVNPGYRNFNGDTKSNCMLCTATYELRRRGYDVTANFTQEGMTSKINERWFTGAKLKGDRLKMNNMKTEAEVDDYLKACDLSRKANGIATNVKKDMTDIIKQGDGARGNIMVLFAGGVTGHSMAYEVKGGKVIIRDAQTNKTYNNAEETVFPYLLTMTYCRLDNCKINPKTIREVAR